MRNIDYNVVRGVRSNLPGWCNVTTNCPRLQPSETMYLPTNGAGGRPPMVRAEQKSTCLMTHLVEKFSPPGGLVVDTCAGTLSTLKACLLAKNHRVSIGCDMDSDCINRCLPSLVLVFAEQVLNPDSDINCDDSTEAAARVFIKEMGALDKRDRLTRWTVPGGLFPSQNVPAHILEHLSQMHFDMSLRDLCRNIPIHQWSELWRHRLE